MKVAWAVLVFVVACGGPARAPSGSPPTASPVRSIEPASTAAAMAARIDAYLKAEWRRKGLTAAGPADDATFLRRVHIDLIGGIPSPTQVRAFLADTRPNKRARLVDELLASKAYADYWAGVLEDLLLAETRAPDLDRAAFHVWLRDRVADNTPWDALALQLLTATGKNSAGQSRRSLADAERAIAEAGDVSPAVNFVLKFKGAPQDFAGQSSRIFLGQQVQCAQCHDHKTEKWTQADFQSFAACFSRVDVTVLGKAGGPRVVEVRELTKPAPRLLKNAELAPFATSTPRALDGTVMDNGARASVARWITRSPLFARAITNRLWGHFLGRGFTNPVDDMRPSNPPEAGPLLEMVANDFAASGHDLKRLARTLATTEVYQLSTAPPAEASADPVLWSHFRVTPLGPSELSASIIAATGLDTALARSPRGGDLDEFRRQVSRLFSFVFDVDEEADPIRYEGSLSQALVLMNGRLTTEGGGAMPGGAVADLAKESDDTARVNTLYLRTLSRLPRPDELTAALSFLERGASAPGPAPTARATPSRSRTKGQPVDPLRRLPRARGTADAAVLAREDLLWALINSSEFAFNH